MQQLTQVPAEAPVAPGPISLPVNTFGENRGEWLKVLDTCTQAGDPKDTTVSRLQTGAASPNHCSHLRNEPASGTSLSPSHFLCIYNSAIQINVIFKKFPCYQFTEFPSPICRHLDRTRPHDFSAFHHVLRE